MISYLAKILRFISSSLSPVTTRATPPQQIERELPVYLRLADSKDAGKIIELIQREAANGHFAGTLAHDLMRDGLQRTTLSLIKAGAYLYPRKGIVSLSKDATTTDIEDAFEVRPGKIWVVEYDNEFAGFQIIYGASPYDKPQTEVEYYMLAITPKFRRKGLASILVKHTLNAYKSVKITARCYRKSEVMYGLLLQNGFKLVEVTEAGTKILAKFPFAHA